MSAVPPSEWLAASGLTDTERFNIGLVVATETGRDFANDAYTTYPDKLNKHLGRAATESELAESLYVQLHEIALWIEEYALTKGMSAGQAMECRLAVLEAYNCQMAGGVQ